MQVILVYFLKVISLMIDINWETLKDELATEENGNFNEK